MKALNSAWIRELPRAKWLDRDRILAWSGILLVLEALFLGFLVLWDHGVFVRIDPPVSTDFVSFYAAGKLALAGTPALAYDRAAHAAAEIAATQPRSPYQFFFYPPVFLLLCAPLALLPYMVAFLSFEAATLAVWMLVMKRILEARGWAWCLPVLAYPAVFWTLGLGQNSFLTAALIGGVTLVIDRRPAVAGMLLGLLCYKPHLALLAPVALAAGGRWHAFAAAAASVAALVALSVALFGTDSWSAYLTAIPSSQAVYENGDVDLSGFVTPYGAARVFGAAPNLAWLVQGIATALAAVAVASIWRRNPGQAVRSAALVSGILISIPLALVYDLLLLTVAMGWLVRAGRLTGFRAWEKPAMAYCFFVGLASRSLGQHYHISLAAFAPAALLLICLARTFARKHQPTIAPA